MGCPLHSSSRAAGDVVATPRLKVSGQSRSRCLRIAKRSNSPNPTASNLSKAENHERRLNLVIGILGMDGGLPRTCNQHQLVAISKDEDCRSVRVSMLLSVRDVRNLRSLEFLR